MSLQFVPSEPSPSKAPTRAKQAKLNAMSWTEKHDTLLCREILAVDPFDTKRGTAERGEKWKTIADNLMAIAEPKFRVEARSVRDRYRLLSQKVKRKLDDEKKASGIETDMSEWETAVEELLEKERECDAAYDADTESKNKAKEEERETAEGMRKRAMEQMGKQKRSADSEERPRKRRSNGSDTLLYLREKNEAMDKCKIQELELKKKELEIQEKKQDMLEKKNDNFMQMMQSQQQQQAKQMQDFQAIMMAMITRMHQK